MKRNTYILPFFCLGALLFGPAIINTAGADVATLIGPCEDCHGKDGVSAEPEIPTIGGMSAIYITDSLAVYRDKERPCEEVEYPAGEKKGEATDMCKVAADLSEEDAGLVAEHYAGKPFVPAKQTFDASLAETGKNIHALNCKKCHEDGGSSPDDDAGILAGQWMPYLEDQFKEYASGERPMPKKMQPKMDKLSADDVKALVHYYGSLQ
jgi:sulfide dehydrogenase cytochrome subunit